MTPGIAPWLAGSIFDTPSFGTVAPSNTTPVSIIPADGRRWLAVFQCNQSVTAALSIDPNVGVQSGLILQQTTLPMIMHVDQWGALVQKQWFVLATAPPSTIVSFFTLSAIEWPVTEGENIILPWQAADKKMAQAQQAQQRQQAGRLKRMLQKCGLTIPEWLNGGNSSASN